MYKRLRNVLAFLHQSMIYFSVLLFLAGLFPDSGVFYRSLFLLIPIGIFWFSRTWIKRVWQMILLHLVCCVFPFLWSQSTGEMIFHETFLCFFLVIRLFEEKSSDNGNLISRPSFFPLAVYPVMGYMTVRYQNGAILRLEIGMCCLDILICFWDLFLRQMSEYVDLYRETADMPLGQMKRVNQGLVAGFLTVMGAICAAIPFTPLGEWLGQIPGFLKELLRYLLGWIFTHLSFAESVQEESTAAPLPSLDFLGRGEGNALLQTILDIFGFCVITLVLAGAMIMLVRFLAGRLDRKEEDSDEKEFLSPFFQDKAQQSRQKSDTLNWHDYSPSGQIRRAYIRAIQKSAGKKGGISQTKTPAELEDSVALGEHCPHADYLHEIYEQARYSQSGCSKEEWNELKRKL